MAGVTENLTVRAKGQTEKQKGTNKEKKGRKNKRKGRQTERKTDRKTERNKQRKKNTCVFVEHGKLHHVGAGVSFGTRGRALTDIVGADECIYRKTRCIPAS